MYLSLLLKEDNFDLEIIEFFLEQLSWWLVDKDKGEDTDDPSTKYISSGIMMACFSFISGSKSHQ